MKYILSILLLMAVNLAWGQNNVFVGQYFKIMPVFAPGLTGANNFLDVKAGGRRQWLGYEGAPQTNFLSVSGPLRSFIPNKNNSLWIRDMSSYRDEPVKIGLGGYVFDDQFSVIKQFEGAITSAVHVGVSRNTYLSLGVSGGINNMQIDVSDLRLPNPDDLVYIEYLNNSYEKKAFKLTAGLAAYSDHYYLSYALMNLYPPRDGEQSPTATDRLTTHHIIGGYSFSLDPKFEVIPNFHARKVAQLDFVVDAGARVRYLKNAYAGVSYRTSKSYVFMLGFTVNDLFDIGYSYESSGSDTGLPGSHEIVLGVRLFNYGKYVPLW